MSIQIKPTIGYVLRVYLILGVSRQCSIVIHHKVIGLCRCEQIPLMFGLVSEGERT